MQTETFTLEAFQFMRQWAGYSYRPALETREQGMVRFALELARAERVLRTSPAWVE
jgi:hypothetical protein